jgi:DNA-directed RNA polymerase specialized sigma24 family protein
VPLSADGFERFLSLLASDRDAAGEQYEIARLKLFKYFELRMCAGPEDLADETIDRVARRLAEGEQIHTQEPMRYVYGVARNVYLESRKSPRHVENVAEFRAVEDGSRVDEEKRQAERRLDCFQSCLEEQPEESRSLLVRYYEQSGRVKVERRTELARHLEIPVNALRIRIHRIKAAVQRCTERCLRDGRV